MLDKIGNLRTYVELIPGLEQPICDQMNRTVLTVWLTSWYLLLESIVEGPFVALVSDKLFDV